MIRDGYVSNPSRAFNDFDERLEAPFISPQICYPSPLICYEFCASNIEKATLFITGLGLYSAFLNGNFIGNDWLTPGFNDYDAYLRFQIFDITTLLEGKNRFEVILGNGWYKGRFGLRKQENIYGDNYLLAVRIKLYHSDGSFSEITTSEDWKAYKSVIIENSIYDGEVRDDNQTDSTPYPCIFVNKKYQLVPNFSPAIRCVEKLKPVMLKSPKDENILDFGRNMVGIVSFINRMPKGHQIIIQHGEVLSDGNFYRENLRSAKAEYSYTSDGNEKTVRPYFTFFGFRYAKISGLKDIHPEDFTGIVLSSDLVKSIWIETSNSKINQLTRNAFWGQQGNFLDIPTDCPQRDERLGWTADTQIFVNTACYHMNCKDFYRKFMIDLRSDQILYYHGDIPAYSPSLKGQAISGGAAWADAATIVPWNIYRNYGDIDLLKDNYPMMREYVETLIQKDRRQSKGHLMTDGFTYGDWVAMDGITSQSVKGGTDETFIRTVYYYNSARLLGLAAAELEYKGDISRYSLLAFEIKSVILDEFITPAGRLAVDTQTAYVLALYFGLWRDKEKIIDGFRKRLQRDSYTIKCGFIGTPLMLIAMFDNNMCNEAYQLLFNEECPGWLYAINMGATTIWERWNSMQPDGSFSTIGMNSFNHYAFGSVCEAIYSRIAGLQCGEHGWNTAIIRPQPNWRMQFINLSYDSPAGIYKVHWQILQNGFIKLYLSVPTGVRVQLILPNYPEEPMISLESGDYCYEYMPTLDYLHPFSKESTIIELMNHNDACKRIEELFPDFFSAFFINISEFRSYSLRELPIINSDISNELINQIDCVLKQVNTYQPC